MKRIVDSLRSSLETDRFWGLDVKKSESSAKAAKTPAPPPAAPEAPAKAHTSSLFEAPAAERNASRPKLSREEKARALEEIAAEVRGCKKCRLWETRTNTVPGEGDPDARLLFIGEGPGATEDAQGRPFVGRAGKLLTDIIEKGMGLRREQVFIANIVKCRPPENREPAPDEIAACLPYLRRQIDTIDPEIIVPLGRPATTTLLETQEAMGKLRARLHRKDGRKYVPTFHPAYLLRNPAEKKRSWEDIQLAMKELGIPLPNRSS